MAEYLSPGVYVEEFDSGIKAMDGVSTSTAGFLGMAEKGPVFGRPVLITSLGEFQRTFGGQLSKADYGQNCYLPYAVEAFFGNGGTTCYVMRVCSKGSKNALATVFLEKDAKTGPCIRFEAVNPGSWGNKISVVLREVYTLKTTVSAFVVIDEAAKKYELTVKKTAGLTVGDFLRHTWVEEETKDDKPVSVTKTGYLQIDAIDGNILKVTSDHAMSKENAEDLGAIPKAFLQACALTFDITDGTVSEIYENAFLNSNSPYYIGTLSAKSKLVSIAAGDLKMNPEKPDEPGKIDSPLTLKLGNIFENLPNEETKLVGGIDTDTAAPITKDMLTDPATDFPGKRIGLDAFKEIKDVSIMAIPGYSDDTIQALLISHCESLASRFAVLDAKCDENQVSDLIVYKDKIDTTYAAIYHPWLQVYSAVEKTNIFIPPSGAMAGIYARTDTSRGVWKAPANEIVKNATGLSINFNEAEQAKLNPKGINLIRAIPNSGIRVWGARTLSADGNWKYVNVRRLFIYVEESIKNSMNWVVFEPNDANLWSRVKGTINVFMTTLWRNGALFGSSVDEAFYIRIGKGETMTDDDINNGRLICEIGFAPVKPAEFVIFRITQKMQDAE